MKFRFIYLIILMLFTPTSNLVAQSNLQTLAPNPAFTTDASFLNPAYINLNKGFQLNLLPLFSGDFNLANNFASAGNVLDILQNQGKEDKMAYAPFNAVLKNLRKENYVVLHSNLTLFNLGFPIGSKENPFHIAISSRLHLNSQFTANGDFFKLLIQGNQQFAGQEIELNPKLSFLSYADLGISLGKTFKIASGSISPAIRLRYLTGLEALYIQHSNLTFYTEPQGAYLELKGNLNGFAGGFASPHELINDQGGIIDINKSFKDLLNSRGNGFAADLGVIATFKNLTFGIGLVDNGSIYFNSDRGGRFYTNASSARWEGFDINASEENGVRFSNTLNVDSIHLNRKAEAFKANIGSKLSFNANYGLLEKRNRKGETYYMNNFGISLLQGFKNQFDATIRTNFILYYQLNLRNHLFAGVNYNKFGNINDIGANFGFYLAKIKFGFGSNSLSTLFNTQSGKQIDVFFNLGLSI